MATKSKVTTSLDVTDEHLRALREEAAAHDDVAQVRLCDLALSGDVNAFRACLDVLREASAQD